MIAFFFLAFVLAIPFWLFGESKLPLPVNLPAGALVTFVPMIAAAIIAHRQYGFHGVVRLVKNALDYNKITDRRWYLPALLLMPLIYTVSYGVMRLVGLPLPDSIHIPFLAAPLFFVLYFISAVGEELGWMGCAIDPLQQQLGALRAAILLGVIWVIWHIVPWVQTGNSATWIVWQGIFSVALRIFIVWIYNGSGGSVFAAILVHAMSNISWSLFPNLTSHYDPFVTSLMSWLTVLGLFLISRAGPKRWPARLRDN